MKDMRKILKMNKAGQVINTVSVTVIALMVLIFIIFAVLFGIATLNPGSFFSAGSSEQNATNALTSNLTTGIANFSNQIPTVLTILGVVFALAAILLLVLFISRMKDATGSGGNVGL